MSVAKRLGMIAVAAILLLMGGSPGWAADLGRILGSIKSEKGTPLAGADIALLAVKAPTKLITVQADAQGKFRVDKLPPGDYAIKISPEGYKPVARPPVKVTPGRSTRLNLILQLTELIAPDPDPRNWDIRTVLRAAQDRRMIFRAQDGPGSESDGGGVAHLGHNPLLKNSTVKISTALDESTHHGVSKPGFRFAFSPLTSLNSRYTVAGQWNPVDNATWKIKNTLDYRLTDQQSLRLSMGYGKTGLFAMKRYGHLSGLGEGLENDYSLVRTFSISAESQAKLSDFLAVGYGLGFDQVRSFDTRAHVFPEVQVLLTLSPEWLVRGKITSRREKEDDTLMLPDGEAIPINDPLSIVQVGRHILWSSSHHYEIGAARRWADQSELAISTYADRTSGRAPFFGIVRAPNGLPQSYLFQLNGHQADSEGVRVAYSKPLVDWLSGSIAYVYATGAEAQKDARSAPLGRDFLMALSQRGSFHVVSTQIEAEISKTRTRVTTILKWVPRKPLTTLDPFSDTRDVANGGVNLFIRQYLPLPLFLNLLSGWEAAVDVRNLMDQNNGVLATSAREVVVLKNPRSVRGSILFRF